MEEEKNGISLRDIFRIIFSQKWLALILAAAITLLCAVCIVYVYNPSKIDYSVSFKLDLLGRNGSAETYRYPDGTTFHYLSLVSSATLNEIKTRKATASKKWDELNSALDAAWRKYRLLEEKKKRITDP